MQQICSFDSMNSCIYYCSLKSYSMWYLPRDYVLIHYTFEYNGVFYIVEKSVEHSEAPKSYKNVVADLHLRITMIEPKGTSKVIVKEYSVVDYGGYGMTASQC